ncbi:MAG: PaaI family thioesterase [Myxococcales bacterium]|nr:PaaI family thioesterase [Myxococcales bacterium]
MSPRGIVEHIVAFRDSGDGQAICQAIPYARFMGISVDCLGDEVTARLAYADHLVGNPRLPALHGGTLGALLETAAIFHVLKTAETLVIPKTITLTIDYLRPARPIETLARGITVKQGRRVVNVRAEAWQDDPDKPVAVARGYFLVAG